MVKKSIRVAVFGCGHGKLDDMYSSLDPSRGVMPPDLVIINGDFQAIRNSVDLNSMSVPQKYRELGDFPKYYSGEKKAPYLTLVIGGNHEASNYMSELSYGGWLAPNIYYLGLSNVIEFGGIRIGGWSGIYNYGSYLKGYMETFPYNSNDIRSIYHTREFQFHKLNHFKSPLDVFISHDWPNGITDYGNVNQLLRFKPFFKDDISRGRLGSPPSMDLLKNLRPKWWLGSHLHCRFTATVNHKPLESEQLGMSVNNEDELDLDELEPSAGQSKLQVKNDDEIDLDGDDEVINIPQQSSKNEDEIDLDDENDEVINIPQQISNNNEDEIDLDEDYTTDPRNAKRFKSPIMNPKQINTNQTTQFLALDKCLPRRQFMEIVEIPLTDLDTNADQKLQLEYNLEWLAIVKAFNELTPTRPTQSKLRFKEKEIKQQIERNLIALEQAAKLGSFDKVIPQNFSQIAPTQANHSSAISNGPGTVYPNPQTSVYCDKLGILNKFL